MSVTERGAAMLTPEQQQKMRNFGKKNGLTDQKIQSQLNQEPDVQNPPVQQAPVQQVPVQQAPVQQIPIQQNQREFLNQSCLTYFSHKSELTGNLEVDLITFREKGLETRYLSLNIFGTDERQNPPKQQEAFFTIETKESFEKLKSFFAQLEWED